MVRRIVKEFSCSDSRDLRAFSPVKIKSFLEEHVRETRDIRSAAERRLVEFRELELTLASERPAYFK